MESCRNDLGKRVGINFPWGQTGRRRTRAPLSHGGGGGGGGPGVGDGLRTYCKYLPLTCHKVFSASGNFVNVNGARGLADIIHNCCTSSAQHVTTWGQLTFSLSSDKKYEQRIS